MACGKGREATTKSRPSAEVAAAKRAKPAGVDLGDGKTMWIKPLRYRNLALLPVSIAPDEVDHTDYLTLDEGMKTEQVKIEEVSSEGTVNALTLRNMSQRPLFALAGEVVIGGKQDRIIGKTIVVARARATEVPVFCVERGRWDGRKADFSTAESIAHLKLRNVADFGDQGEVWQEVSVKNAYRGASNSTDTYRDVALQKGAVEDYQKAIGAEYEKMFPGAKIEGEDIVGFAVAYNGQIVGIEAFRSPKLFTKLRRKLLHSYYVDAIDREYDKAASAAPMATEAATKGGRYKRRYTGEDGTAAEIYSNDTSATTSWSNAKVKGTEVRLKSGDGKASAKPVYESAELQ